MASRVWWNIGRGAQVGLGHPKGLLDVPQVVVVRDHPSPAGMTSALTLVT